MSNITEVLDGRRRLTTLFHPLRMKGADVVWNKGPTHGEYLLMLVDGAGPEHAKLFDSDIQSIMESSEAGDNRFLSIHQIDGIFEGEHFSWRGDSRVASTIDRWVLVKGKDAVNIASHS